MNGIVGYLYQSAKDAIKWSNQNPKDLILTVMAVGRLHYLSSDEFKKIDKEDDSDIMSLEQLNNLAIVMQKVNKSKGE